MMKRPLQPPFRTKLQKYIGLIFVFHCKYKNYRRLVDSGFVRKFCQDDTLINNKAITLKAMALLVCEISFSIILSWLNLNRFAELTEET